MKTEWLDKPAIDQMKTTAATDRSREKSLRSGVASRDDVSLLPFFSAVCHPASRNAAGCLPSFPDRDGWYGGDGAYSILLDDGRTLWLFGDTFVSDREDRQNRVDMDIVLGTTLAISTCSKEGRFNIRYFLKKEGDLFSWR
jgi:hypothetical protein